MLDHHPDEPFFGFQYDYKKHTLFPCLRACIVFIIVGLVIFFRSGPLDPWWSVPYFAFALYFLWYARHVYKQGKFAATGDQKTAQ